MLIRLLMREWAFFSQIPLIRRFRGGNLFFEDGSIVYESTLNVAGNIVLGGAFDDIRIIEDEETIRRVNDVLRTWVVV